MLQIEPIGAVLGATVYGIDLRQDLEGPVFTRVLHALGHHGVLRFPDQELSVGDVQRFSELFGEIQGSISRRPDPDKMEHPNVGILSNLRQDGKYIGSPDAGQDWHTDMSYRDVMGFVNVLYGIRIPRRDGKPLGGTEFANMHAVYDALPYEVKTRLDGTTATHDFEKFWENMRQNHASTRPGADRRATQPSASCGASGVPSASDHRPEGAVRQSRLHHAHQRIVARRKRCDAAIPVRLPAPAAVPLDA